MNPVRPDLDWLAHVTGSCEPGILVVSAARELVYASEGACRALGAETVESLRERWRSGPLESIEAALTRAEETLSESATVHVAALRGQSGARLEIRRSAARPDSDFVILVRDGSSLERLEADLFLAAKMRVTSRLFDGVTHGLFSTLNSLVVNVELLRQVGEANPDSEPELRGRQERCLANLRSEIFRLSRSLRALLDGVRLAEATRGKVDLAELARDAVVLVESQARFQRVAFESKVSDRPASIDGDRNGLRDAMLCLAAHALEPLPAGGRMELVMMAEGGFATIEVRAQRPVPESPGSGSVSGVAAGSAGGPMKLVVSVARAIAESHGGSIRQETVDGGKTCLTMSLPLTPSAEPRPA